MVFPLAEHADLWKQSLQTRTEAITLGYLIEQALAQQLRFIYLHFDRFLLCGAQQQEFMGIETS